MLYKCAILGEATLINFLYSLDHSTHVGKSTSNLLLKTLMWPLPLVGISHKNCDFKSLSYVTCYRPHFIFAGKSLSIVFPLLDHCSLFFRKSVTWACMQAGAGRLVMQGCNFILFNNSVVDPQCYFFRL